MITSRSLIWALVLPAAIGAAAYSQAKGPDEVAAFPHPVGFTVSLDRSTFETREPVIAHVTLTNLGDRALRPLVRDGGAPRRMALEVSRGNGPYRKHSLWLGRNGPQAWELELGKGESTSGDILLLLDYGKEYVFSERGRYHLRWTFYPGSGSALVYTDEVQVRVIPSSRVNEEFLDELELIAFRYHGGEEADILDLSAPELEKGMDREGVLLLGQIIRQNKPHLVDPERNPEDKREAELVDALADLLDRHPDSSYAGYIARFLGLVHIKTFERVASHGHLERWTQKNLTEELQVVYDRAARAREEALRYLTMASRRDLWPRTTAYFELAHLYGISEQWDKVEECTAKLRTIGASNGIEIADRVEREIARYRKKLERRTPRDN